jgi:hypothetical protein
MMRGTLLFGAVAALAGLPTAAVADWEEDFEAYEVGSGLHGQGGWECWDNDTSYDVYISDAQSHSPTKSVEIALFPGNVDGDIVHQYSGYTSGQWTFAAWQYIPSDYVGEQSCLLLNTYNPGGPHENYHWSNYMEFSSYDGVVYSHWDPDPNDPNSSVSLPLIYDEWAEIRVEIDLDADWQQIYYGGELLSEKGWTDGIADGGAVNIGAVDLYANFVESPIYYDDMSLKPGAAECAGDIDGDGDTDHSDLGALLAAWCTHEGDPNWNPNADLDGDGHVGHGDLGILLADWGCGVP